jgi:Raf kinase inhibitor-like YbhB/YbcL family protein
MHQLFYGLHGIFFLIIPEKIMAPEISTKLLKIDSPVFENEELIPSRYTCEGEDINPPLTIGDIPEGTKSLALIMEDPDAPNGTFDHWLEWNIPVINTINENSNPGISGVNGFGKTGYGGPCPPSGTHRYFFRVYALDAKLDLEAGAEKKLLLEAIDEHILAMGEIMAKYQKKNNAG